MKASPLITELSPLSTTSDPIEVLKPLKQTSKINVSDGIKLTETNPEEFDTSVSKNLCLICQDALANYVCPKCQIKYCSLKCYQHKDHSNCSENFYQSQVESDLTLNVKEDKDIKKMENILLKFQKTLESDLEPVNPEDNVLSLAMDQLNQLDLDQEDSGSDNESLDEETAELLNRFEGTDLNKLNEADIWAMLGEGHQEKFLKLIGKDSPNNNNLNIDPSLNSAKLTSMVPVLLPWWIPVKEKAEKVSLFNSTKSNMSIIEPLSDESMALDPDTPLIPSTYPIPTIFLPPNPHQSVAIMVFNTIFSYCLTYRVLGGFNLEDLANDPLTHESIINLILELTPTILPPGNPNYQQLNTLEELYFYTIQNSSKFPELNDQPLEAYLEGWNDVVIIITQCLAFLNRPIIKDINTDEHSTTTYLELMIEQVFQLMDDKKVNKPLSKLVKLVKKKIVFLNSWIKLHFMAKSSELKSKEVAKDRIKMIVSVLSGLIGQTKTS